jgi:RNA polymerase sigma-70 factor (ECF subfamily)
MEDTEILLRIKHDKREGFEFLVKEYGDLVINVAYSFFGNRADALDCAQDTFIRIYDKIHTFRGNSKLSTWIYRVTVNVSLNELRKQKKKTTPLPETDNGCVSVTDSAIEDYETQTAVRNAVLSLPDKLRAVIILKDFEDRSYDEISDILQISIGTVSSRISRAREALKKILICG